MDDSAVIQRTVIQWSDAGAGAQFLAAYLSTLCPCTCSSTYLRRSVRRGSELLPLSSIVTPYHRLLTCTARTRLMNLSVLHTRYLGMGIIEGGFLQYAPP